VSVEELKKGQATNPKTLIATKICLFSSVSKTFDYHHRGNSIGEV
jgi:hypothetical protein